MQSDTTEPVHKERIHCLLSLDDVSETTLDRLVRRSVEFHHDPKKHDLPLMGKIIGVLFTKTSTRTRTAFSVGTARLGGTVIAYGPGELQLATGESIDDTARILGAMLDGLVIRTSGPVDEMRAIAERGRLPVINAMAAEEHPTQAICDLATVALHFGDLQGIRMLYVGEGNNTAAALVKAFSHVNGAELTVATPAGYEVPTSVFEAARRRSERLGTRIVAATSLDHLPTEVDVVYTSRWQTTGTSKADASWREVFRPFYVDQRFMSRFPDARFMHDLPAHRGDEVSASVLDGKSSLAWIQGAMKLGSAMAVLEHVMGSGQSSWDE